MGLEVPRLVHRLRETFSAVHTVARQQAITEPSGNRESLDSPLPGPQTTPKWEKALTRRTGWEFAWDVRRSRIEVQEGEGGPIWTQKVGELPPNVQRIIALGGLEKWVKREIEASI